MQLLGTPKSAASINTADLEHMLKMRKEAKRSQPDTQEEEHRRDGEHSKQQ